MNYYEILECQMTDSFDIIKKNYKRLSLIYHPDKGGTQDKFIEINTAYHILSDPIKRKDYDLTFQKKEKDNKIIVEDLFNIFKNISKDILNRHLTALTIKTTVNISDIYLQKELRIDYTRIEKNGTLLKKFFKFIPECIDETFYEYPNIGNWSINKYGDLHLDIDILHSEIFNDEQYFIDSEYNLIYRKKIPLEDGKKELSIHNLYVFGKDTDINVIVDCPINNNNYIIENSGLPLSNGSKTKLILCFWFVF
jgi:curved DNA-binding protein CbpA